MNKKWYYIVPIGVLVPRFPLHFFGPLHDANIRARIKPIAIIFTFTNSKGNIFENKSRVRVKII